MTLAPDRSPPGSSARPLAVTLAFALLAAGCGGAQTTASEPAATDGWEDDGWGDDDWGDEPSAGSHREGHASAIETLGITGPETPWDEMSAYDREMYMVGKVLPIMHDLFARQDGARWSAYGCESCHGEEMREVAFRMPAGSAFSVPAEGTPAWTGMERTSPEIVRFMREQVTPTMATLLGQESFTCTGCHPAR